MIELDVPGAFIDSPEWSPDGSRLAYTSTDDDGMTHIWVASADGGSAKQITDAKGSDDYPTFSPDGSEIAFASTSGGAVEQLTSGSSEDVYPAWDPNGGRIVYSSKSGDTDYTLDAMAADHLAAYAGPGEELPDGRLRWRLTDKPALSPTWTS